MLTVFAALHDRLPDPLAVHWDLHGRVDNTAGVGAYFTGTLVAAAVLALGSGLVISRSGRPDYAVTIPHAAVGAEVLNALLVRERAGTQG